MGSEPVVRMIKQVAWVVFATGVGIATVMIWEAFQ